MSLFSFYSALLLYSVASNSINAQVLLNAQVPLGHPIVGASNHSLNCYKAVCVIFRFTADSTD
jgi:hypothetical protein